MVDIPRSPIMPGEIKQSASYSGGGGSGGGGGKATMAPNRGSMSYKMMALHAYSNKKAEPDARSRPSTNASSSSETGSASPQTSDAESPKSKSSAGRRSPARKASSPARGGGGGGGGGHDSDESSVVSSDSDGSDERARLASKKTSGRAKNRGASAVLALGGGEDRGRRNSARKPARIAVGLSFYWHPLSITIEAPAEGRAGCSRVTELSRTARRGPPRTRKS